MDPNLRKRVLQFQKSEITEYHIYAKLARMEKNAHNRKVLEQISRDELGHYQVWQKMTGETVKPCMAKVYFFTLLSKTLGLTFGLKLMELGESKAEPAYGEIASLLPEAKKIQEDEARHEKEVLNMINEEKLSYIGSMVLGLNDALVELTGALAGFTFALQNPRLIAVVGLITGMAASLSMAASEYLSTKSEETGKHPLKASLYTGIAYVLTVIFLIFPFFFLNHVFVALGISLFNAVLVILVFTFYTSVAKDLPFKKRFLEMLAISLSVTGLSFMLGFLIRTFFHVDI